MDLKDLGEPVRILTRDGFYQRIWKRTHEEIREDFYTHLNESNFQSIPEDFMRSLY